jgi:hypothetical protein
MKKIVALLALLALFLSADVVLAQDGGTSSPFADLADEQNKYRTVRKASGSTLQTYQQKLDEYQLLSAKYEESYGSARIEMGERVLARGKDVLLAKLGAIGSHSSTQKDKLESAAVLSDKGKEAFASNLSVYRDFVKEYEPKVNVAENVPELVVLSMSVNSEGLALLNSILVFKAPLSILSGRTLIDNMMDESDLFQAHIDAAVDAGADVTKIQQNMDTSMLNLEEAKIDYSTLENELDLLGTTSFRPDNFRGNLARVNQSILEAQEMLKEVIVDLEVIYGQSPWDVSKYL